MDSSRFSKLSQAVIRLDQSLDRLLPLAEKAGVASPENEDWHALLKRKLIPQLSERSFLIVSVMGGTNTGKSLVFNHLVGSHTSAVDHRAAGTKHPVCLVPKDGDEAAQFERILQRHFDKFRLVPWKHAGQPLETNEEHHLFWVEGENVPKSLLLLDTPDIDSDAEVNWDRARSVRHAADVIIAVLTEQKYNDAAVRRFFREAGEADKPVIVLFNMFDLKSDLDHLPRWIDQFCDETHSKPFAVFVAPHDRNAAEKLEIPFYEYTSEGPKFETPVDLRNILSELQFDTIKTRTLLGAVRQLTNAESGIRSYLKRIDAMSAQFAEALTTLGSIEETTVHWPGLPSFLLVDEVRRWWNEGRPDWSKKVNGVYRTVGSSLLWPLRKATSMIVSKPSVDPLELFRMSEHKTVAEFVGTVVKRLEKLAETSNPILRDEIIRMIGGERRAMLVERAHQAVDALEPVDDAFRKRLQQYLSDWAKDYPQAVSWLRSADTVATAARPVITVTLALSGLALGAHVGAQALGEAFFAGGVTAGGEAMLHVGGEGIQQSTATLFAKIQEDFVASRSRRFYQRFHGDLWNDLIGRLKAGAEIVESQQYRDCVARLTELNWDENRTE